jgi:hypothetical protein
MLDLPRIYISFSTEKSTLYNGMVSDRRAIQLNACTLRAYV